LKDESSPNELIIESLDKMAAVGQKEALFLRMLKLQIRYQIVERLSLRNDVYCGKVGDPGRIVEEELSLCDEQKSEVLEFG